MKKKFTTRPGVLDGVTLAMVISLAAAALSLLLGGFIVYGLLFELLLYGASLTYLLYLLRRSNARIGRLLVIASWATLSLGSWILDIALIEQVLLQAGLIWLVRSLYFHGSLFSAALDFGLVSAGLAASAWAMLNTGSLAAALWSFFLVQALFSWLPQPGRKSASTAAQAAEASTFQTAHRVAEDAVRKLSQI